MKKIEAFGVQSRLLKKQKKMTEEKITNNVTSNNMAKVTENISLGVDTKKFEAAKQIDAKLFDNIKVLKAIAKKDIGGEAIDNYFELLDNPITYLSELYWARFGDKFPSNADRKATYLRQSNFTESQIMSIVDKVNGAMKTLRNSKPIIEGNTITSGVNEDDCRMTVHKNKVDSYELIKSILKQHKKLASLNKQINQEFHLVRLYAPLIGMRGGIIRINEQYFIQA